MGDAVYIPNKRILKYMCWEDLRETDDIECHGALQFGDEANPNEIFVQTAIDSKNPIGHKSDERRFV